MKTSSLLASITLLAIPLFAQNEIDLATTGSEAAAAQADLISRETQTQVQHTQTVLESAEMQKIAERSPAIKTMMARDLAALKDAAAATAEGNGGAFVQ
jgi:hypothetical protein